MNDIANSPWDQADNGWSAEQGQSQGTGRQAKPIFVQYWLILQSHMWLIAATVVAALIAGFIITLLTAPQYRGTARIEIARQQNNVTNVQGVQQENASQDQEFYATQHSLLKARSLAERVARRLRLGRDDAFFTAHGQEAPAGDAVTQVSGGRSSTEVQRREDMAVAMLLSHVNIAPIRNSALVDIQYMSGSPQISARVANAWIDEFIRQSIDRRFGASADARQFLETRLNELRQRLDQSERDLVNYAEQTGIVRLSETQSTDGRTRTTTTLASADLEALNRSLADATAERITAEGRMNAAGSRRTSVESAQSVIIGQLRQRRAELAGQYAQLMVRFEPEYPDAQALRQQMATIDASISAEERRVSDALASNFEAARQREAGLQARVATLSGRLNVENRSSIQYNIFQREVDTNRQLYDALLQRYKEIGVAGVSANNISVVDRAEVPTRPSSPKLPLNLALALVMGLAVAGLIVLVLENVDEGISDPQQVSAILNTPMLGAIPLSETEDDLVVTLSDPKSELAEAYMTMRTNLGFSTDHGVPRTLSLTSTSPAEGKSTTSLALSLLLGRTGKSVVLVDIDMRRPVMAAVLGLDPSRGVSNFLSGDSDLASLIQTTNSPNLSFIAAGPIPPSAAELLSGDRLGMLIAALSERFDHVIVDGPPMLGLSDAPLIGRTVEAVVYVVEAQRTSVRGALAAIERLRESRAHIVGTVLTKYRPKNGGQGYGYGYGYGYGRDEDAPGTVKIDQ